MIWRGSANLNEVENGGEWLTTPFFCQTESDTDLLLSQCIASVFFFFSSLITLCQENSQRVNRGLPLTDPLLITTPELTSPPISLATNLERGTMLE